ncbi:Transposase, Mutator family [Anatilimnocola aggregata]|uniref:Mutator family transposase n=1 Tax=Anatilimnocola aggregata TaxID=2528021 RepID=A0A517YBZ4_9BACT|nr:Transposase, Mutator family [Anatilimnocola aggregata]
MSPISSPLTKDRDALLTFYDFSAEHWRHLWTTNPIESTFATIRLRHRRTKGSGSRLTSLTMMFVSVPRSFQLPTNIPVFAAENQD